MNKEQLIKIAKAGFPDIVKEFINFDNCEMHYHNCVYRLYYKDVGFRFVLPLDYYLAIFIGDNNFINIDCQSKAFNHYAAIKEMERLGLI